MGLRFGNRCTDEEKTWIDARTVRFLADMVTSRCPLSDEQKERLMDRLESITVQCERCTANERRRRPFRVSLGDNPRITFCHGAINERTLFRALSRLVPAPIDREDLEIQCMGEEEGAGDKKKKKVRKKRRAAPARRRKPARKRARK